VKDIYNFLYYHNKLSSSGMPTVEQLKSVAEAGVEVVINLATSKSEGAIPNEGELVNGLGMKYIHIPVDWDNPTKNDLKDFLTTMDKHNGRSILVHCQANYRATGFVALYRILRLGWKPEDAFVDMHKIWNADKYPVWKRFIKDAIQGKEKDN
jgi:protein tyrosine phosphatase (PTP) superfamily phosphohydrolase (DUF442 family)